MRKGSIKTLKEIIENTDYGDYDITNIPNVELEIDKMRNGIIPELNIFTKLLQNGFYKRILKEMKWNYINNNVVSIIKDLHIADKLKHHNFFIYGKNRSGKTYLTHLLAKLHLQKYNRIGVFCRFNELLKAFNVKYDLTAQNNYKRSQILIIDEFGKGNDNDYYLSNLEDLFEYRLMNYLPIIIATNYTLEELTDRGYTSLVTRILEKEYFTIIKIG